MTVARLQVAHGQTLYLRVKTQGSDGSAVRPGEGISVRVLLWSPRRDPDADEPDADIGCQYDPASRQWMARADTSGWTRGLWYIRAVVTRGGERGHDDTEVEVLR